MKKKWYRNLSLKGADDRPILLDVVVPDLAHQEPVPLVLFCHGFKGFKDWGHFDLVAEAFANAGLAFLKFNFSHNGTTPEKPKDFADLEAFGQNNFSKELHDLKLVIDWVSDSDELTHYNFNRTCLLGHSRGGGIAILGASQYAQISRLVTWAAVSDYSQRLYANRLEEWKAEGVIYIPNARTQQEMPLYYQLYENFVNNREKLDIPEAAKKLQVPYLIVHGAADIVVLKEDAAFLHQSCPDAELVILEGTGHTFDAAHPWESREMPPAAQQAVEHTVAFFLKD